MLLAPPCRDVKPPIASRRRHALGTVASSTMEIIIRPTPAHAAKLVAHLGRDRVRANRTSSWAAPPAAPWTRLRRTRRRPSQRRGRPVAHHHLQPRRVRRPPHDDERSYHHYMRTHLFEPVGLPPERTNLPDGTARDLAAEARGYEARIAACGGIDLQLLGLGVTGHIGFNEPLSSLMSRTREKALTPETREQNAGLFGGDARCRAEARVHDGGRHHPRRLRGRDACDRRGEGRGARCGDRGAHHGAHQRDGVATPPALHRGRRRGRRAVASRARRTTASSTPRSPSGRRTATIPTCDARATVGCRPTAHGLYSGALTPPRRRAWRCSSAG
jgi:hypothetical protein